MAQVKAVGLLAVFLLTGCASVNIIGPETSFAEESVITRVREHTVSIATIYAMSEEEWQRRVSAPKRGMIWRNSELQPWQEILPIQLRQQDQDGQPVKFLAYIGAGTILKDNYALTASHLFGHGDNAMGYAIYVFKAGMDHAVECDLVIRGNIEANWINDYAIIRLREDLGLPGLKVSKADMKQGDKVIFSGSVGGLAFFTRFGYVTQLQWYFNVGADGKLHLSPFGPVVFWSVYPGGPGDSGGSVKNVNGEVVGIIAWGVTVHEENYCLVNPIACLWEFLEAAGLGGLGE